MCVDTRALSPSTGWLQGRAPCTQAIGVLALAVVHSILVLLPQTHTPIPALNPDSATCWDCYLSQVAFSPIFEV